ncbi:hypothetical protein LI064_02290 [Clostridium perfringens]|uniref:hypothetical protein n=1 Tax=Clostridium perfringens TaxID=1502 RepID=UPI002245C873|nr:hypothetical protein [Clostridium perfringens]MCX0353351.1 hypothetical protein [Clostridium perfringens]
MENTKQIVQEMREELVNHFKYLGEIREACNPEHLESLTNAMLDIYSTISSDTYYCSDTNIVNVELDGESIARVMEEIKNEVKALNLDSYSRVRCIEIPEFIKQPIAAMHSTMAIEFENKKMCIYKKSKEGELSLPTINDREIVIDDALTCDFLVKKIVDGKEVISRVEGYVILLLD